MIFEHEIPSGSRLYFGQSARLKRQIENSSAKFLQERGYEEMVTPLFSYHQHESFDDPKALIRLNDTDNHEVSLRADSTADVVRIATKRLGRSTNLQKWFYIQPVYRFPTKEQYQIGAEYLGGEFAEVATDATELLKYLQIQPLLQIANIAIPRLLSESYGVSLEAIKKMNIQDILDAGYEWLDPLIRIHRVEDLEDLSLYPEDLRVELKRIKEALKGINYHSIVVSPLYYAKLRYYDSLIFRLYEANTLFATGGTYKIDGMHSAGFALMSDACIAEKITKGNR